MYDTLKKVVISDTLRPEDTAPWTTTTEVTPRAAAHDRITELKGGSGGDILCFGSLTTWSSLLALGLVDELLSTRSSWAEPLPNITRMRVRPCSHSGMCHSSGHERNLQWHSHFGHWS